MIDLRAILRELGEKPVVAIDEELLRALLAGSEILKEERPPGVDPMRVLRFGDEILFQETSDRKEILVRRFASRDEAYRFVRARLDAYDRVWDGCGCKIDYWG
ncbi:MAG: hypothetical protein ABIH26_02750 [Candidatus Eisenbacteria bacterium]